MASIRAIPDQKLLTALNAAVPCLLTSIQHLIADKLLLPEDYVVKCLQNEASTIKKFFDATQPSITLFSPKAAIKIAHYLHELLSENEPNRVAFALEKLSPVHRKQLLNAWRNLGEANPLYRLMCLYYSPTQDWYHDDVSWIQGQEKNAAIAPHLMQAIGVKRLMKTKFLPRAQEASIYERLLHLNFCDEDFRGFSEFRHMGLCDVNLKRSNWNGLRVRHCHFTRCDFSGSTFEATFYLNVTLREVSLGNDIVADGSLNHTTGESLCFVGNARLGCDYFNSIFSGYPCCAVNQEIIRLVESNQNPIFAPLTMAFEMLKPRELEAVRNVVRLHNFDINKYYSACYLMGAEDVNDFNSRLSHLPKYKGTRFGYQDDILDEVRNNLSNKAQDCKLVMKA